VEERSVAVEDRVYCGTARDLDIAMGKSPTFCCSLYSSVRTSMFFVCFCTILNIFRTPGALRFHGFISANNSGMGQIGFVPC
jgi:hypothetical protein